MTSFVIEKVDKFDINIENKIIEKYLSSKVPDKVYEHFKNNKNKLSIDKFIRPDAPDEVKQYFKKKIDNSDYYPELSNDVDTNGKEKDYFYNESYYTVLQPTMSHPEYVFYISNTHYTLLSKNYENCKKYTNVLEDFAKNKQSLNIKDLDVIIGTSGKDTSKPRLVRQFDGKNKTFGDIIIDRKKLYCYKLYLSIPSICSETTDFYVDDIIAGKDVNLIYNFANIYIDVPFNDDVPATVPTKY